ncbi:MAG: hypothetical protein KIT84_29245 [Labilithrix sp.]|nr:hypothetical protein [Labilithrix sp.]MCW5815148.1 hypothetical protein [Labilithrix sp.]
MSPRRDHHGAATALVWRGVDLRVVIVVGFVPSALAVLAFLTTSEKLYAAHNGVSALAAYPAGHAGDRGSKLGVLLVGYVLGLAFGLPAAVGCAGVVWLVRFRRASRAAARS